MYLCYGVKILFLRLGGDELALQPEHCCTIPSSTQLPLTPTGRQAPPQALWPAHKHTRRTLL